MDKIHPAPRETAYDDPSTFLKFLSYTNEKEILSSKISELVGSLRIGEVLDIGGGDGSLVKLITTSRSKITFVEPSEGLLEKAGKNLAGRNVKILGEKFEDITLSKKFDLILLSHVIDNFSNWEEVLKSVLELKRSTGKIIIVTHSDESEYLKMVKEFWPKLHGEPYERQPNSHITKMLRQLGQKPEIHLIESSLSIPSVEEALHMSGFLFYRRFNDLSERQKTLLKKFFASKANNEGAVVIKLEHFIVEV